MLLGVKRTEKPLPHKILKIQNNSREFYKKKFHEMKLDSIEQMLGQMSQ